MPIYEYRCKGCRARFEILIGVGSSDNDPRCPFCRSRSVERLFSPFSFFDSSNSWRAKNGAEDKGKSSKQAP